MVNRKRDVLRYRRFSIFCLYLSIVVSFLGAIIGNVGGEAISNYALIISLVALFIYFIVSIIFWRCPFCKKRLPMRFDAKNNVDEVLCPYCEANLLYGEEKK
ncbi:hypothetical protein [Clostridium sp.]|uniref:hypothetical protein n=1 Tax=Clostridium sp. TaxID=1506 RepID=UPI0029131F26|nr:hypothetical protein [Clostridium sp.]MDU5105851.1 hypothetical protein [Clostridium sp.]